VEEFSRRKNLPALFHSFAGHSGPVLSLALSSDFKYVVSGSEDATVKLWDLHARRCVRSFAGHAHAVRGVDVVASFTKEALTGGGHRVGQRGRHGAGLGRHVGDVRESRTGPHQRVVNAVAYTPDGAQIASASADRSGCGTPFKATWCTCSAGKYLLTASNYGERMIILW
jgi:WD40 repeat protein